MVLDSDFSLYLIWLSYMPHIFNIVFLMTLTTKSHFETEQGPMV